MVSTASFLLLTAAAAAAAASAANLPPPAPAPLDPVCETTTSGATEEGSIEHLPSYSMSQNESIATVKIPWRLCTTSGVKVVVCSDATTRERVSADVPEDYKQVVLKRPLCEPHPVNPSTVNITIYCLGIINTTLASLE